MTQPKNTLVIFDLVSTLTDAGPRYAKAFREACEEHGVNPPTDAEVLSQLGNKNLSEITDTFVGPMDAEKKQEFMDACNNTCDAILYRNDWHETLYPNVRTAMDALHDRGIELGIFTGTREDAMASQLAYHDIAKDFDSAYCRGKDNARDKGKTNDLLKTEQLQSIVSQFRKDAGVEDVCIIIVGDSSSDFRAAQNLGVSFVGFAANETKKDHLQKAGVKNLMRDFKDLPGMIAALAQIPAPPVPQKPLSSKHFPRP